MTNDVHEHRLGDLEATTARHDEAIHGNGKPGLRERTARLEWAFLVLLAWVSTSSPVAQALLKALGK